MYTMSYCIVWKTKQYSRICIKSNFCSCASKSSSFKIISGPPTSDITGLEEETEEGQSLLLRCSSNSTTVPETHNLKMETMWYLDGRVVESRGRFRVCDDELTIDSVMKTDNNLEISCRAKEQMGLTTWTNKSLHVNC